MSLYKITEKNYCWEIIILFISPFLFTPSFYHCIVPSTHRQSIHIILLTDQHTSSHPFSFYHIIIIPSSLLLFSSSSPSFSIISSPLLPLLSLLSLLPHHSILPSHSPHRAVYKCELSVHLSTSVGEDADALLGLWQSDMNINKSKGVNFSNFCLIICLFLLYTCLSICIHHSNIRMIADSGKLKSKTIAIPLKAIILFYFISSPRKLS